MEVRKIQYLLVIVLVKWRLIFLGILQVVRFEVWEVLVVVVNVGGGMLIISDSGSGKVWFEPPLFHLLILINSEKNRQSNIYSYAYGKKLLRVGGGGDLKEVWLGLCC